MVIVEVAELAWTIEMTFGLDEIVKSPGDRTLGQGEVVDDKDVCKLPSLWLRDKPELPAL